MRRHRRRGKVPRMCSDGVAYWLRMLQMGKEDFVRQCYGWQINNLKFESW
jgi:hypothetical protein